jgi:hypothetical protein
MSKSENKTMLISFFDIRGIIHYEFVSEGNIVNQTFYVEALKRVTGAVKRKRGELWRDCSLIFTTTTCQHILRFECHSF